MSYQEVEPHHHQNGLPQGGGRGRGRGNRHKDIERYTPGAFHHERQPLPNEEGDRERRMEGRRGGGWGRGRGGIRNQEEDLRERLQNMNVGGENGGNGGGGGGAFDLRHRLNQRSAAPEMNGNPEGDSNGGGGRPQYQPRHNNNRQNHRRVQGRGAGVSGANNLPRPKRNTENFNPSHDPVEMRILAARPGLSKYDREITSRDVIVVNDLFGDEEDLTTYNELLDELKNSGVHQDQLWQLWHGDSHVIADDKRRWKENCPTFARVVKQLEDYFEMDIKATRLNWYRDSKEWKPFHHDAAALKPDKARTQNFTVAVSFGMERDAAFEHAKTKTVISMPQPNGTIYTFGKDVNILWRHGILQCPPEKFREEGRISIIAWGWVKQTQIEC